MIYGLGMLEMGITLDYGKIVIDNDVAAMVRRVLEGIPVDDENLATDLIHEVGSSGNFLVEKHTLKHMKAMQSLPMLMDRNMRHVWEEEGSTDLPTRAVEEAKRIMETHEPVPLPKGAADYISDAIKEAEEKAGLR